MKYGTWGRWLKRLFPQARCGQGGKRRRLRLESLEERLAPAVPQDIWTGAAGDGNWDTANNWQAHTVPNPGDQLVFGSLGAAHPNTTNNIPGGLAANTFDSIVFQAGGPGYTLSGNPIAITGDISVGPNLSTPAAPFETINMPLSLLPSLGTLSQSIFVDSSSALDLTSKAVLHDLGPGIGAEQTLNKTGAGTLEIDSHNATTYTGAITIGPNGGTVVITTFDALGNGAYYAGTNAGVTTVGTNSQLQVDNTGAPFVGATAITENLITNGSGLIGTGALLNVAGTNTWAGNATNPQGNGLGFVEMDSDTTIGTGVASTAANPTNVLTISAVIQDTSTGHSLTKVGNGQLILTQANTYRGDDATLSATTRIANLEFGTRIENGILTIETPNALGNYGLTDGSPTGLPYENTVLVDDNATTGLTGTLQILNNNVIAPKGYAEAAFVIANEQIVLNGPGFGGIGALDNAAPTVAGAAGSAIWTDTIILGSSGFPNVGNNVQISVDDTTAFPTFPSVPTNLRIAGSIIDPTSGGPYTLTKVGGGRLILTHSNTYSAATIVAAGILNIEDSQTLGLPTKVAGTTVAAGAALELELQTDNIAGLIYDPDLADWGPAISTGAGPGASLDSVTNTFDQMVFTQAIGLAGTGVGGTGALRSVSGINTWGVGIALGGLVAIGVDPDPNSTNSTSYFTNDYSLTVTGDISGGSLQKVDNGHLILPFANTYGGTTEIVAGWVTIENNQSFGPPVLTLPQTEQQYTKIDAGAALQLKPLVPGTSLSINNNFILSGTGLSSTANDITFGELGAIVAGQPGQGAIENLDGANILTGIIQLSGSVAIGVEQVFPLTAIDATPSQLTITGNLWDYSGPPAEGPASGSFLTASTVPGGLIKVGSQRLVIQGQGTYSGNVAIDEGPLLAQSDTALGAGVGTTTVGAAPLPNAAPGIATVQQLDITNATNLTQYTLTLNGNSALTGPFFNTTTTPITYVSTGNAAADAAANAILIQNAINSLPSVNTANSGLAVAATVVPTTNPAGAIVPGLYTITFGGGLTGYDQQLSGQVTAGPGTFSNVETLNTNGATTFSLSYGAINVSPLLTMPTNTTTVNQTGALSLTESGNVVTATFAAAPGFVVGQTITVAGATPAGYNGTYVVASVAGVTVTYNDPTANLAAATAAGTVSTPTITIGGTLATAAADATLIQNALNTISTITAAGAAGGVGGLVSVTPTATAGVFTITFNGALTTANKATVILNVQANLSESGNVVTATFASAPGFVKGQTITVSGALPNAYNGTFFVTSVSGATVTYTLSTTGLGSSTTPGTVTSVNLARPQSLTESGNVVTATFAAAPGFVVGQTITVAGALPAGYNGTFVVTSASGATVTYNDPTANLAAATAAGTFTTVNMAATVTQAAAVTQIHGGGAVLELGNTTTQNSGGLQQGLGIWGEHLILNGAGDTAFGDQGALTILAYNSPMVQSLQLPAGTTSFTLTYNNATTTPINLTAATVAVTAASETVQPAPQLPLVTITANNTFAAGDTVLISGVGAGYNGTFTIYTANATSFTYYDANGGLVASSGGTVYDASLAARNIQAALNALGPVISAGTPAINPVSVIPVTVGTGSSAVVQPNIFHVSFGSGLIGADLLMTSSVGIVTTETLGGPFLDPIIPTDDLWAGPVTLNSSSSIDVDQAQTSSSPESSRLVIDAVIDDAPNLSVGGSDLTLTGNSVGVPSGGGELDLVGANTYRGVTYVNQGVLSAENSLALGATGISPVQTFALIGGTTSAASANPTTFNLTFNGVTTTTPITYTGTVADATAIQNALNNLSSISNGTSDVNGSASVVQISPGVWQVTLGGSLSGFTQPQITASVVNNGASGTPVFSEVQTLTFSGATSGSTKFTLTFNGVSTSSATPITYTGSPTDLTAIQNALNALLAGQGTVSVTQSPNGPGAYSITFVSGAGLVGFNTPQVTGTIVSGSGTLVGSTGKRGAGGTVVANGASLQLAGGIQISGEPLQLLGNGAGPAPTVPTQWFQVGPTAIGPVPVGPTSIGTEPAPAPPPTGGQTPVTPTAVSGTVTSIVTNPVDPNVIYIGTKNGGAWRTIDGGNTWVPLFDGVPDIQQVVVTAPAPSGSFTLSIGGVSTTAMPFNATASQIQTALDALLATLPGDSSAFVTVTQTGTGTFSVTFEGSLAGQDVVTMGGAVATVTTIQVGIPSTAATGTMTGVATPAVAGLGVTVSTLAIGAIALDPNNPNIVYIGTGVSGTGLAKDGYYGYGTGLYESMNGGVTWSLVTDSTGLNPFYGQAITSIAVDPLTGDLFVASSNFVNDSPITVIPSDAPGIWRLSNISNPPGTFPYNVPVPGVFTLPGVPSPPSATWFNLTNVVSSFRSTLAGAPKTPGPDDDFLVSFPQVGIGGVTQVAWTQVAVIDTDSTNDGNGSPNGPIGPVVFAALGTPTGSPDNGVFRTYNPDSATTANQPVWYVGDPGLPNDQVETLTITGPVGGGNTFQLSLDGVNFGPKVTFANDVDQSAAIAAALGAVIPGGAASITVTGAATVAATTYTITFGGVLGFSPQPLISFLLPPASPLTLSPAIATPGGGANTGEINGPEFPVGAEFPDPASPWRTLQNIQFTLIPPPAGDNVLVAVTLYASIATPVPGINDGALANVYVSSPGAFGGLNWNPVAASPSYGGSGNDGSYDNAIVASTASFVFVGGQVSVPGSTAGQIWETTTGGAGAWTDISTALSPSGAVTGPQTSVHVLVANSLGNILVGTDGGIWLYNVGTDPSSPSWFDLNGNLATQELNSVATAFTSTLSNPTNTSTIFGGVENEGVAEFVGTQNWSDVDGNSIPGDISGGQVYVDQNNASNIYAIESQYDGFGLLRKSTDGGVTWTTLPIGIPASTAQAAPFVVDPINSQRLLLGTGAGLEQSLDGGATWTALLAGAFTAIAIPEFQGPFTADPAFPLVTDQGENTYDGNTIYVTNGTTIEVTKDGGQHWQNLTTAAFGFPAADMSNIVSLTVDPNDRDVVYAVRNSFTGSNLLRFDFATGVWTNIGDTGSTTGLPTVPAWSVVVDPRNVGTTSNPNPYGNIYVGTDLGVYELADAVNATWVRVGVGMPDVQVRDLVLNQTNNTLLAATYGRGTFEMFLDAQETTTAVVSGALVALSGQDVWTGLVELAGNSASTVTIGTDGAQNIVNNLSAAQIKFTGQISDLTYGGDPTLIKIGLGDVTLTGANIYGGLTQVGTSTTPAGNLVVGNAQGLGATASGTIVYPGSTLELISNLDAEPVIINGPGVNDTGALRNADGFHTYSGPLTLGTLQSADNIGADSGSQLTLTGTISSDTTAPIKSVNLAKVGTGTVVLAGANNYDSTFPDGTGSTNVTAGALQVENNNALSNTQVQVTDGAQLQIQTPFLQTINVGGTPTGTFTLSFNGQNAPAVASAFEIGNTATIVTTTPHNYTAGEVVTISGVGTGYNGTFTIVSTPTPTSFTFTATLANLGALGAGGNASVPLTVGGITAQQIQNALNSLPTIGGVGGSVTVTPTGVSGQFNVVFGGILGGTIQPLIAAIPTPLSGAVVTITQGLGTPITLPADNNIRLTGTGINSTGALLNTGGDNTINGNINLTNTLAPTGDTPPLFVMIGVRNAGETLTINSSDFSTTNYSIDDDGTGHPAMGLTKVGAGELILQTADTYRGQTTINNGILDIQDPQALGNSPSNPSTAVVNSNVVSGQVGTLALDDQTTPGFTVSNESLQLNGVGFGGIGALDNLTGNNTWAGGVTLVTASSIGASLNTPVPANTPIPTNPAIPTSLTLSGGVVGSGAAPLTKVGAGTLIFPAGGNNTYTGGTIVTAGSVQVDGVIGNVLLNGGTVSGTGTVGTISNATAPLTGGGAIDPGDNFPGESTGQLNSGTVTLSALDQVFVDLGDPNNPPTPLNDLLDGVNGNINLNGATLSGLVSTNVAVGDSFVILQANYPTDTISGTFAGPKPATGVLPTPFDPAGLMPYATTNASIGGEKFVVDYYQDQVVVTRELATITSFTLTPSFSPTAFYGQQETFTATVTPEPGGPLPTGTVVFQVNFPGGGSSFFPVAITPSATNPTTGVAVWDPTQFAPFSALGLGPYTVTATYNGVSSTNVQTFTAPSPASAMITVIAANTTTTLKSSFPTAGPPPVYGQSITFTATVARVNVSPAALNTLPPAGTVTFKDTSVETGTTSSGSTSVTGLPSTAALAVGASVTGTGIPANTTIVAITSPTSITLSQSATASGSASLTFVTTLGTGALSTITGVTNTTNLVGGTGFTAAGTFPITFTAPGGSGTTAQGTYTVSSGLTVTNITITNPGSGYTTPPTITFTGDGPGTATATAVIGSITTATFATSSLVTPLGQGTHTITAVYNGDGNPANYNASPPSANLTQNVNQDTTTTTINSSQPTGSVFGQTVTFTATVAANPPTGGFGGATPIPTGTVHFFDNGASMGFGTLNASGVATISAPSTSPLIAALVVGNDTITAVYSGDPNFSAGPAGTFVQTVGKDGTTTSLSSTPSSSVFGQNVTFTATVTVNSPGVYTIPAGVETVTFQDASVQTGTTTSGSKSVTGLTSTAGLAVGVAVTGTGIPANTTIVAITSSTSITLSQSATASGSASLTFITTLSTGLLNASGMATFQTSTLSVGNHSILAVYAGDADAATSTGTETQVVDVNTTTTVSSSLPSAVFGQPVTFTATITATAGGPPTGTVQFLDNGVSLGSPAAVSTNPNTGVTTASFTTTPTQLLPSGSPQTITAVYTPSVNSNFIGSQGTLPGGEAVSAANTTTTVSSSLNPSSAGQQVTFTATIIPTLGNGSPIGMVTFYDFDLPGGDGTTDASTRLGSVSGSLFNVTNGMVTASFTTSANQLPTGANEPIIAVYTPSADPVTGTTDFTGSQGSLPGGQTVAGTELSTTFIVAPTGSGTSTFYGQPVTFKATVTDAGPPGGGGFTPTTPTGTVSFYLNGTTLIGSGTLSALGGAGSPAIVSFMTTSPLPVGSDSITAVYDGDSTFNIGAPSAAQIQTVSPADTRTGVASSLNPSSTGQSVTFTATVSVTDANDAVLPTGTVLFYNGTATPGNFLGQGTLSNVGGVATATYTTLPTQLNVPNSQTFTILAVYSATTDFSGSQGSLSQMVMKVGNEPSTTTVSSSGTPSPYGQAVTFTATVKDTGGSGLTPTGTVQFYLGAPISANLLNSVPAKLSTVGGVTTASYTTTAAQLPLGTDSITAVYSGDYQPSAPSQGFAVGSPSAAFLQVVKPSTTTTVTASPTTTQYGASTTFTATISPNPAGSGTPTGTVQFLDGATPLGQPVPLSANGTATLTTAALQGGNHTITAVYSGDATFFASLSSGLSYTVAQDQTQATVSISGSGTPPAPTFTATIVSTQGGGVPAGQVTFIVENTSGNQITSSTVTLSNGVATLSLAPGALMTGNYTLVLVYGGNADFLGTSISQGFTVFPGRVN